MLGNNKNFREELIGLLEASLVERKANVCET